MLSDLNFGNSIFEGFNDKRGIMLCGYEWGFSAIDKKELEASGRDDFFIDNEAITTFSNKVPAFGRKALTWRYDNRIKKWFSLWGHPLKLDGVEDAFSKSIVQTNWNNTCNNSIPDIKGRCLSPNSIDNFICHLSELQPEIIIFIGSELKNIVRSDLVFEQFIGVVGKESKKRELIQKNYNGVRFKVCFDYFEHCTVICFPHASGSVGLSDDYISLFSPEMDKILSKFKTNHGI